jgi:hypothetical protein
LPAERLALRLEARSQAAIAELHGRASLRPHCELEEYSMFRKIALALSATAMVALPATADARYYYRSYGYSYLYPSYGYGGYYGVYHPYGYGGYYRTYGYPAYGYGYPAYGYGYSYPTRGYGYAPHYYRGYGYHYHCTSPVAGMAVGGLAGAAIGSALSHNHYHYRYGYYGYHHHSADGAIAGAAIGAILGGAVAASYC